MSSWLLMCVCVCVSNLSALNCLSVGLGRLPLGDRTELATVQLWHEQTMHMVLFLVFGANKHLIHGWRWSLLSSCLLRQHHCSPVMLPLLLASLWFFPPGQAFIKLFSYSPSHSHPANEYVLSCPFLIGACSQLTMECESKPTHQSKWQARFWKISPYSSQAKDLNRPLDINSQLQKKPSGEFALISGTTWASVSKA
jgi:hypothetical protein